VKSVGSGQRIRYFFNGLTEEIRNVPVVTQRDRQPTRRALGRDRWFHYDQVSSVIARTGGASGSSALQETIHQDAFGNTQASWSTGLWGGAREGWHHNAKDYDGDSGLVYMYQRWYSGETGTFMSSAPYPAMVEHRYGFAKQRPTVSIDANGRSPFFPVDILPVMPTSPMYQGEGRGVDLLCGRSNPYHRQGQPHQHISWNLGNRGVPYSLLWWGGRGWETAQGLGALGRGDDFIDPETNGRNSDGSDRGGSGYQPNDIQLNDEGYNKGDEDRKRENECRERLARRDWA